MAGKTAIRHPKRGKAHRAAPAEWGWQSDWRVFFACSRWVTTESAEHVPLVDVAPADRCRICWKEVDA